MRRILAATIDASVAGVSGPTCCDAIQGDLFFNQVMLDDLESIPNPSRQIKDVINYLKGRVDQGQADKGYCC